MFHFVFDSGGAERIGAAMDMDDALDGEIIQMNEDYSVGPIHDLFSDTGMLERRVWWSSVRNVGVTTSDDAGLSRDADVLDRVAQRMREEQFDQIWIWIAPNARDVCGYYWLMSRLIEFTGRIYVLHLNNLPFISETGTVFYPRTLGEIPVREFIKARKLVRLVTPAEFETDPDEWNRLSAENKNLRTLEGGKKIVSQPEEFYDRLILNLLQPNFQKVTRLYQQFAVKTSDKVNEIFFIWRLRQIAASAIADFQGESVRLSVKTPEMLNSGQLAPNPES